MNLLDACTAGNAANTEETYRIPCVQCARRARRLRNLAALSQWVVLASLTASIGFAAARMGPGARAFGPYDCGPASPEDKRLDHQSFSAHGTSADAQTAAPRIIVIPAPQPAPSSEASTVLEGERPHRAQPESGEVGSANGPVEPSAPADAEEPVLPPQEPRALEPELISGGAGIDEGPEPPSTLGSTDVPDRLREQLEEGRRKLRKGQFVGAELAFRRALAVRQGHPLALAGLARVYLARGKLDRARAFAERAVQQAPYQAPYRVLLGDVLRTASESQAAESEYRLASRLNPSKPIDRADRSLPTNPF